MKSTLCLLLALGATLLLIPRGHAQADIPLPGTPEGDLRMELLQCRAFCKGIEIHLALIEKRFPGLGLETATAKAAWITSPFAGACRAIEEDISRQDTRGEARAFLKEADRKTEEEIVKLDLIRNQEAALDFLKLTGRRAKGEIEIPMVRGNLLWQYRPYQEPPEKEAGDGFMQTVSHPFPTGPAIRFQVPMSWKEVPTGKPGLMSFMNCYGHGNVWMTVLVQPTVDALGQPVSGQEKFDAYNQEDLAAEYARMDITLTSFMKTKVNRLPALLFTRKQPYEQLGTKAQQASEAIRVFTRDHLVAFQINTLGPEDKATAEERIKKNRALFKMIGGSLGVAER